MHYDKAYGRMVPDAGPEHFKSYSLRAPLSTHWRQATCEEYECEEFLGGFFVPVDTSTELGVAQFRYMAYKDKSRKPTIEEDGPNMFRFVYPPGTDCFEPKRSTHRVPVGRPPLLLVAEGDFRGNPRGIPVRRHRRVEDWVDDFATTTNAQAEALKKG